VSGNVQGLSPDEALDALLSICNLVARRDKKLIYVLTQDEVSPPPEVKSQKIATRVYRLNHVQAKDVEDAITPFLGAAGKIKSGPDRAAELDRVSRSDDAPSPIGEFLVVQDDDSLLGTIDEIVLALDVPQAVASGARRAGRFPNLQSPESAI